MPQKDKAIKSASQRIKELSERYGSTLSDISGKVTGYETKVREHLAKMGY